MLIISLILLLLLPAGVQGQENAALQELLATEGLGNAAVGISVKRVVDGTDVVAYHPAMALTPASVTKIIPTWFALQEKGADYRYRTVVYYTGEIKDGTLTGDITLKAGGDPTLDSRYFPHHSLVSALVNAIQKAGIRQINGKIRIEGAKAGTDIPGSWPWEDVSNYYGALYLPFNYRDNTYTLQLQSGAAGTPAKLVSVTPELPDVEVSCDVMASAVNKDNAWIFGGPFSSALHVRGTIPANRSAFKVKGAIHNPAAVFVHELSAELLKKGIRVEQNTSEGLPRTELITLYSPRLQEIVFHTNKVSVNLFAESLGVLTGGDDWQEKAKALFAAAGINAEGITLNDACGLSPMDAVPAGVFTDLLVYIGKQDNAAFLRSLPVAGVDGGLAGYCYSFPQLKNNMKAKTGSMSGVRCLAGYITRSNGEQLAFTVLINHYTCTVSQLQRAVGRFLAAVSCP